MTHVMGWQVLSRWSHSERRMVDYIVGEVGSDAYPIQTSPVVEVLEEDGRTVRTRSGSIYRLAHPTLRPRWRHVAGVQR
jgi:hypothetical protein